MLLTTALALLMPIQAAATIDFESRAAPVATVVAALAKAQDVKLEVSPNVGNEIIVVHANGVTLQSVLDKIALVSSAEWQRDGEVTKLVASTVARSREASEERTQRLNRLRKSLADRLKARTSSTSEGEDSDEEMDDVIQSYSPVDELLKGIDLTAIAAMNAGDRIVYATNPTAMQRRLPSNTPAIVQTIVTQHNASIPEQTENNEELSQYLEKMPPSVRKMIERQQKPVGNPSKALFVVSAQAFTSMQMVSAELRLYDAEGNVILSQPTYLDFEMPTVPKPTKAGNSPVTSTPITYSEDSKALLAGFQGSPTSGMKMNVSPELRAKLMQPDVYDPLSFTATDELLSVAAHKKKSLVANVSDAMMDTPNMMVPGSKATVEEVEASLAAGDESTITETEGWVVIRPTHPATSRTDRTDRVALANLVQAAKTKALPTLDEICAFAVTSPSPMQNGVGRFYAIYFVPGMMSMGMGGITDWDAFKFYGTLGPSQKSSLSRGQTLAVGAMSGMQKNLWSKMVFGASSHISAGTPKIPEDPFEGMMSMGMMGMNTDSYLQEPTELMPNGLPPGAFLQFNTQLEPIANPVDAGDQMLGAMGALGPSEIALLKMFTDDPNLAAISSQMPQIGQVRIGERTIIQMNLILPKNNYASQTLNDNKIGNGAPVAFNDLPADFKAIIEKRTAALKASPMGELGALMGTLGSLGSSGQP
jgi:hypothetical protein